MPLSLLSFFYFMTFACICTVMRLPKNKTGRKCAWLCVCVCGVGWSAWMGARGRARVFPRNNNNREGNDDKLKLEHFNFKEPQADKKKAADLELMQF